MSHALKPLAWVEISRANLCYNLRQIRKKVGRHVEVMAIVKADAYGHGMHTVSRELWAQGVRQFGVANLNEALELRRMVGRKASILVLGSFHWYQAESFIHNAIRPTLSSREDALIFRAAARKLKKKRVPVHVKMDTGMGRLGIWHEEAENLLGDISKWDEFSLEGIYTHFSASDAPSPKSTHRQIELFSRLIHSFEKNGIRPKYWHAANSMGLARFRRAHLNLVRPGIILYGINPVGGGVDNELPLQGLSLKPVMSLKARITLLKTAPRGRTISYGSTYTTPKNTVLAVVPVGYSHGYRVGLSNRAVMLVHGRRCPVVGRVTMDQTLIDVGDVSGVKRWDVATLIGTQGKCGVGAQELARILGTIPYEIVCGISARLPRYSAGVALNPM